MNDTISREAAIDAFDGVKVDEKYCTEYEIGYNDGIDFAVSKLSTLPSAQPEQSDDAVSRADMLETYADLYDVFEDNDQIRKELHKVYDKLNALPSAQPEQHYDEWCTDCKEYDRERHCCPRWNRVIRETLNDACQERKTARWIPRGCGCFECDECGELVTLNAYTTEKASDRFRFCYHCGARMLEGEQE